MAIPERLQGFTLIELVVIIVLIGIVALIAAPRFSGQGAYDAVRFHDAAIGAIRYAQKAAVAQRTTVFVVTSASAVQLCYDAACTNPVPSPADNAPFVVQAPNGITVAGSSLSYTPLGQPNPNAMTTLTISGDTTPRQIVIEQETGYVHK